jgi:pimeloyl-ACP methyl ester carboxylesterase
MNRIHEKLHELGYLKSRDEKDSATIATAVRMFQINNGLDADGIVGAKTEKLLLSSQPDIMKVRPPVQPRDFPNIFPLKLVFDMIVSGAPKREDVSAWPGFRPIAFQSGDGCIIHGWTYKTPGKSCDRGTCVMGHGFCDNSTTLMDTAKILSKTYGITIVAIDFRYHGWSEKRFPTFGCYEGYDLQAAMDFADVNRFPKPYILHGTSLGGMAAQRAAIDDRRVAGAFLVSTPGWPWDAIGKGAQIATPAANLISLAYGWDVLNDGDILRKRQPSGHHPFVCHVMGNRDRYDINLSKEVFRHWHHGEPGIFDRIPKEGEPCRKLFFTIDGAVHPGDKGPTPWDSDKFKKIETYFYRKILKGEG